LSSKIFQTISFASIYHLGIFFLSVIIKSGAQQDSLAGSLVAKIESFIDSSNSFNAGLYECSLALQVLNSFEILSKYF
jgi:hypothetical protein